LIAAYYVTASGLIQHVCHAQWTKWKKTSNFLSQFHCELDRGRFNGMKIAPLMRSVMICIVEASGTNLTDGRRQQCFYN